MNLARLASHVSKRARIIGFLAEQMRERQRNDLALRASLEGNLSPGREHQLVEAALAARREGARQEKKLHDERWQSWLSVQSAPRGAPTRRNRPEKYLEKMLSRLGPLGGAAALSRSGLWNGALQTDNRPEASRPSLLSYAGARPSADTTVKSLFDQRFYLEKNPSVATIRRAPLLHYLTHGDRENRAPHPLVDVVYYRAANPHELASSGLTVLQHFIFIGAAKGLNPHPLFDVRFYVSQLSDPHDFAMNPLAHYLRTGWRRGLNPHPIFDNDGYLEKYPDVAELMIAPLLHYALVGAKEGRDPHALFSTRWYQTRYPDVPESGQNPLAHFLDTGLAERRDPRPEFNSGYYMRQAPDAYSKGLDPLRHYVQTGAWLGLSPNPTFDSMAFLAANPAALSGDATPFEAWMEANGPASPSNDGASKTVAGGMPSHRHSLELVFDAGFYVEQAGDLLPADTNPLDHFLAVGWRLGLNPNRLFDTSWYVARYPEVLTSGLPPLLHFVINGARELQDPHPLFDSRWYVTRYPDVADGNEIPLVHFLHFGAREGRSPSPLFDVAAYRKAYPDIVEAGVQNPLLHFLTRWPFDDRPQDFASDAARRPQGVDPAEWIAGLAESLAQAVNALPPRNSGS